MHPSELPIVRWFVGLGAGTQPAQIEAEKTWVKEFNEICGQWVYINLEIVPSENAYEILKTLIAAGNAPDLIGPVGVRYLDELGGGLLDLKPWIDKYGPDLGDYEPAAVDYLQDAAGRQLGLPYTIWPGYLFYRPDLLEAAGLPDLPHRVGETYQGRDWTWETLASVARQLTVDKNGRGLGQPGFSAVDTLQYGFAFEWADARRIASSFRGGSLVAADGRTAQIPSDWAHAWRWYYEAMWTSRFAYPHRDTALLNLGPAGGLALASGRIAMEPSWPWAIPMYARTDPSGVPDVAFRTWDIAVMPSYGGRTSSPMDADTFVISSGSSNPDRAYLAMLSIIADPTLMALYGGMPARKSRQGLYFASLDKQLADAFPGNKVDWSVLAEMSKYPAQPSHNQALPGSDTATQALTSFLDRLESQSKLDLDAEMATLRRRLQAAFDEASASSSP